MKNLCDITILIPLRIDSDERKDNMDACLTFLSRYPDIRIIVLEADTAPKYKPSLSCEVLKYCFIEDNDPIFHRTRYLNILLRQVQTPFAGIWDSDVIVPVFQISEAIELCRQGATLCYPYDGHFYNVTERHSRLYRQSLNMDILSDNIPYFLGCPHIVGGAFVVHVAGYLSAGGENENFYGWGPEDSERRERISTWGLTVKRTGGCLYHLYHPRGLNSFYADNEHKRNNLREYLKICKMKKFELQEYILNSRWIQQLN